VGGILRDIFTMGARPIALPQCPPFWPPRRPPQRLADRAWLAGHRPLRKLRWRTHVAEEVAFDSKLQRQPLVNAMALGLMETEEIVCSGGGPEVGIRWLVGQHHRPRMAWAGQLCLAELSAALSDDRPGSWQVG